LQNLAKADILVSERGKKGGFRLERDAAAITMHDVVTAIDGELQITDCLADVFYCNKTGYCKVHVVWKEIQTMVTNRLKQTSLNDLSHA
jgi:Rrf2 family protein